MTRQGYQTGRAVLVLVVLAVIGTGCSPKTSTPAGTICNLPQIAGWTRGDFDAYFGRPVSVDILPNGRADTVYTYDGTTYYATFGNSSAQATMTSLLIETLYLFADADDLMFAVGYDPVPSVRSEAPARIVYSTVGTDLTELAAMRSRGVSGDWSKVFAKLIMFD